MAVLEFNTLLKVSMSTYYGNIDDSEWVTEWMSQDLKDISHDWWHVTMQMLDWSVRNDVVINDIYPDFNLDWDTVSCSITESCEKDIDGSVMMASDHKFQDIKELLAAYWMEFKCYEWFMPKYYNYDNDSLDLIYDLEDWDWSLEKYWLTELVQKYIDEVRVESYDGYYSFEPSKIEDVCWNDYCVMWAILQKEWVFDTVAEELQELANYNWYEFYQAAVENPHYERREDTMPDKWDWYYQDRYKIHYFILHYDEKYLQEVEEKEIYPPKND